MSGMTATLSEPADVQTVQQDDYRAMSGGAVAGLLLGFLSAIMLGAAANSLQACLLLAPVPILGILVSTRALSRIRSQPDDYCGGGLAKAGLFLSAFFLVSGLGSGLYLAAVEVPDGYEPISFLTMKPDAIEERGGTVIPPDVRQLDGQRVFIKGYMRPQEFKSNLATFLLVRDNQQCCFGPLSDVKYYDQMRVELTPPLKADYSNGMFRVGGRLKIQPENLVAGSSAPVFTLVADYLK
jgi:hypothetical protein